MKSFISNFIKRSGNYIFIASIISRLLSFFASWIALQIIPSKELGIVLFSYNIITFIIPFSGLGLYQSLIRYAPFLNSIQEKDDLFNYTLKKGIYINILIVIFIVLFSFFIPFKIEKTQLYFAILAIIIIPDYIFSILKIQFRIHYNNRFFALAEILYNVILVSSIALLSFFYNENGYAVALIITPFLTSIILLKKFKVAFNNIEKPPIVTLAFWKYGLFASLNSVVSQLLVSIDILLIGILLVNPIDVTSYRYISIIPMSVLFLPQVLMNTDFVNLTENIYNKNYIMSYIKNYTYLFVVISIFLLVFSLLFSKNILHFFDENLMQYHISFTLLMIGICAILILRGLYGNLLSSIGYVNTNLYIGIVAVILNILGNYVMIPKYGIKGAAITSSLIMWFTSILTTICFFYLYKRFLTKNNKSEKSAH